MIQMTTLKPLTYAGKTLYPGNEFQAHSKQDARILEATGKARIEPLTYQTAVMVAETKAEPKPKPKRAYRRRNLTAE